jgi:superfamily I DNA/RNA helicase
MWKITNIRTLKERLKIYLEREIAKARVQNSEKREQEITDRVETLGIFIARCETLGKTLISDVVAEIEALFADNVTYMIRLSTGHKAKGREFDRVFWLRTTRRQQRKEWETISERNIEIVIGTRPLNELILVPEEIYVEKRK